MSCIMAVDASHQTNEAFNSLLLDNKVAVGVYIALYRLSEMHQCLRISGVSGYP